MVEIRPVLVVLFYNAITGTGSYKFKPKREDEMTAKNVSGLNEYLKNVRGKLNTNQTWQILIGNEASDLDSMASSVTYAYWLNESKGSSTTYLPVMNIPRADFKLRTEAVYLFNKAGVDLDNLVFTDEIDLKALNDQGQAKFILMDHNKLASNQDSFADNVVEVMDHHADEGLYTTAQKVIELVGSTTTLVCEKIIQNNPDLLKEDVCSLLLGTILLDTVNLDPEAERVTPKDDDMAHKLMEVCSMSQQDLFDKIQFEKFNVASLDTVDLLRKDYKEWQLGTVKCGIGSVLLSVTQWDNKDKDLKKEFYSFCQSRSLDVLFAMNAYTDPDFHRELVVYSPNKDVYNKTLEFLNESNLNLEPINLPNQNTDVEGQVAYFKQGHLGMSRKKLQPLLNEFYTANK